MTELRAREIAKAEALAEMPTKGAHAMADASEET